MITVRAFRAVDELKTCERFLDGHRKVLEEFNLENVTTNVEDWMYHKGTYVVIAEYQNEILGGARLQIADNDLVLPLEEAVLHFDPKIKNLINEKIADGGASELCGLWNSRSLPPNLGITRTVSIAAVSLAQQLNNKNIFAICAGYTLYPAIKMGMVIQKQVGNNGEFVYPNSNFRARVLCMNGLTLETSNAEFKADIQDLINNPQLTKNILVNDKEEILQFNLNLNVKSIC
jgi:hypothetical protein